jgi:acyl phosphate:glycerol-3-phosphate acyltransferase
VQIIALAFLGSFLLGSVPFGLILTKLSGGGDLRSVGSGNIGATNVLRTGKKWLAGLTLLLDLFKGTLAVLAVVWIWPTSEWNQYAALAAALGAVLGHCFSVFLKFSGGKGVATYAGVAFGLSPVLGGIYAVLWIGILAAFRISSIGGLVAAVAMPIAALVMGQGAWALALLVISGVVVLKHSENIQRLRAGTEPRIGRKDA